MLEKIKSDATAVFSEIIDKASLKANHVLVIGCSTSEIIGDTIGTHSSVDAAKALYDGFYDMLKEKGIYIAVQCCEHLNRALVVERELAQKRNLEIVSVIPQPKAGGSSATTAYSLMDDPVLVEHIKADAGVDIGFTLIGMHLKDVAVPLRLDNKYIGKAQIVSAYTRPKYIGGERAVYN
ncbi:MAG: TIGR01440 family protein [Ruminococcus sp.]|nr:TIGR01440 family protein [Ruminococcus sp.]